MGLPKPWECLKGDITVVEVCIERSSQKSGVWITMWKNENDHYQVSRMNSYGRTQKEKAIALVDFLPEGRDYGVARDRYEEECRNLGVEPYPKSVD